MAKKLPSRGSQYKVSAARRIHILDGDATGGGHGPGRGMPGKSEFPNTLSDDEIIQGIEDIANDPTSYPGSQAAAGRLRLSGTIKGMKTTVIIDPASADPIVSAWPEGVPRNP